jgi:hypothetical protein
VASPVSGPARVIMLARQPRLGPNPMGARIQQARRPQAPYGCANSYPGSLMDRGIHRDLAATRRCKIGELLLS